jgi:hypothetical protein
MNKMRRKMLCLASFTFALLQMAANSQRASAANVMNYGADGNDYFQFTTPSMAFDKASGFTTLITFAMHVNSDGTLVLGGVVCTNGVYVGPTNWGSLVATLKTAPTTVTRYEVSVGGYGDTSFANIENLVNSQGTGSGSILYKNFQALRNAVPGINAINDDDEQTYNLSSSTSFANMLGGLGYKFTLVPYTAQSFWVNLKNSITNCDYIYLQCYEGGAGNDPGQWNSAFGNGVVVIPGQESNTATTANWRNWHLETGVQGGFYYPDVVFESTYFSAAIIEGNGAVPAAPTGVTAVPEGRQVSLSWNSVPGAIFYNVKRSTSSGGETTIANVSTLDNNSWPASNEYIDDGLAVGTTYYYEVSGVNTNGESLDSAEVSAMPLPSFVVSDLGFEAPSLGIGNFQYDPSGAAWTFSGASPNGSGIVANRSAFGNTDTPEGVQAAFVQAYGTITQPISGFIPGTNYTITFLAAERQGYSEAWNVTVNGTVVGSYNPGPGATIFVPYTASFTATAATETVAFVGTDLTTNNDTVFIDDVQITGGPVVPPPPPTGLAATAGNAQVSLNWNVSTGAASYNVNRSTTGGGPYATAANVTGTNFLDTGLSNGTTYYYVVSATNGYGESANSSQISATPPGPNLTTVSNFGFENPSIGSGIFAYAYNPSGASWTFSGASPNGSGIVGNGSAFSNPNAPERVQAAFVQSYGTITQSVSGFIPGTNYTITFLAAERPGYSEAWNVTVNGTIVGSYSPGPGATAFAPYTATFTATRPTETLAFVGADLTTNNDTVFIDDVQIVPSGVALNPVLATNTLPVTAADVVGSQVTFTAAFVAGEPIIYQWQKISSGMTNNIPSATNTTFILANLQLTNTASYQLRASNAYGVAVSSPGTLTVSSVPAAVNNIITVYAAQTGLGGSANDFYTTWTVSPRSLIAGQSPSSVGGGNFSDPNNNLCGTAAVLTDGSFGFLRNLPGIGDSPTEVACGTVASGAGQSVTYTLTGSISGYNLTNITVYGGWGDAGRDQQAFTVYYSKKAAPATFIQLSSVNYNPVNTSGVQSATRAILIPANGLLATNVAAVKLDFTTPVGKNGYEGYSEIDLYGAPAVATNPTNITVQFANNNLTLSWPTDHLGWQLQAQTNDVTQGLGTNWVNVTGSTGTNQMSFPINSVNGSVFFRLLYQ